MKLNGPVAAMIFTLLLVCGLSFPIYYFGLETRTRVCTVIDKDNVSLSFDNSDLRVYTKECGVLRVANSFFEGDYSSIDRYGAITVGEKYTLTTRGVGVPFTSLLPNIVGVEYAPD